MTDSLTVLKMLKRVPKGRVTTYGALARACKTSPRAVGQIMRRNPHPEIYPCYKVMASDGTLHGFGGCTKGRKIDEKAILLRKDGIAVKKGKIDLQRFGYDFRK